MPFSYTIFFLDGFLDEVEAVVLLGRAVESAEPCGWDLPLFGRLLFSAERTVGGFRRGLEGAEEWPLTLIGGNGWAGLVLLLAEGPTRVADEESNFKPPLSGRRGLLDLASDLWLTL